MEAPEFPVNVNLGEYADPMRGQPEMTRPNIAFAGESRAEDLTIPGATAAYIAKLEAQVLELQRAWAALSITDLEDKIAAQDETIRCLADENAALRYMVESVGLHIYGTEHPGVQPPPCDCATVPNQVCDVCQGIYGTDERGHRLAEGAVNEWGIDRSKSPMWRNKCAPAAIYGTDTPECPDQVLACHEKKTATHNRPSLSSATHNGLMTGPAFFPEDDA